MKPTTLKLAWFAGSFEEDTAKNEGIDGCHRQVQVVYQHVHIVIAFKSVGNIFTGLGLLAEVNQQLGEEGPGIGLQRLSRFVPQTL